MLVLMPAPIGPGGAKLSVKVVAAETLCAAPKNKAQPIANEMGVIDLDPVRFLFFVISALLSSGK